MTSPVISADLEHGWSVLGSAAGPVDEALSIPAWPIGVDCGFGPVRLALGEGGRRRLLIPVASRGDFPEECGGEGIVVQEQRRVVKGQVARFVDVLCADSRLADVFTDVTAEILRRLQGGAAPLVAVPSVLQEFRELLRRRRPALSKNEMLGLVGELFVLRKIVRNNPGALRAWTGPSGGRHDFTGQADALEVKTTLRRNDLHVEIHGIDQLEAPPDAALYLVYLVMEESPVGDLSVPLLVDAIREAGVDPALFAEMLGRLGVDDHELGQMRLFRLRLRDESCYRVSEGFPRITRRAFRSDAMPQGVIACSYTIDLAAAVPFRLDANTGDQLYHRMATS